MKKKWSLYLVIFLLLTISIFLIIKTGDFFVKDHHEKITEVNKNIKVLTPLYKKEKESVDYFYKQYQTITNLHQNLITGRISTQQFIRQVKLISPMIHSQFDMLEDFRLSYRYRLSKQDLRTKEFNNLYYFGYRTRWRLLNFIDIVDQKDLSLSIIKVKYQEEIKDGYEIELPLLLDLLRIPASEYPLGQKSSQQFSKMNEYTKSELKYNIYRLLSKEWVVNELQIGSNDTGAVLSAKIHANSNNEVQLSIDSESIIKEIFDNYPGIKEISLFWERKDRDYIFIIGLEREAFNAFLATNRPLKNISTYSFLYRPVQGY